MNLGAPNSMIGGGSHNGFPEGTICYIIYFAPPVLPLFKSELIIVVILSLLFNYILRRGFLEEGRIQIHVSLDHRPPGQ